MAEGHHGVWLLSHSDRKMLRGHQNLVRELLMSDTPKGVSLTPPPTTLLADATRIVQEMSEQLPAGAKGGIIGVATDGGWNAAVVHRAGDHFEIGTWIGKTWKGGLTGGAAVKASW